MTTAVYSRRHKEIAADRKNTDSGGMAWEVNKIELLVDTGKYFLGSGHCRGIGLARAWASTNFDPQEEPDWEFVLEDEDERGMQCLIISANGDEVQMINGELTPMHVQGDYFAVGSGAAYAIGALEAGASPVQAVEIAAKYDGNTGCGVDRLYLGV